MKVIRRWSTKNSTNRIRWTIKNPYDAVVPDKPVFVITIIEKIKETRLKFEIKIFSRKGIIKNGKLSRSEN